MAAGDVKYMHTNFKAASRGQMSEAFITAVFLSMSGGLQDAYTYIYRGGVFANAQTGNIVLLSANLFAGEWAKVPRYLVPLCFFALGVWVCEKIRLRLQAMRRLHWRQLVVLAELVLLLCVGFMPENWNLLANAIVSFACAMQVQAFRKVDGYGYASTMCIGNLRSGMEALCVWQATKAPEARGKALRYFGIILLFALGAGMGSAAVRYMGGRAIWLSCVLLAVSFGLMFVKEDVPEIEQQTADIEHVLKAGLQKDAETLGSVKQ